MVCKKNTKIVAFSHNITIRMMILEEPRNRIFRTESETPQKTREKNEPIPSMTMSTGSATPLSRSAAHALASGRSSSASMASRMVSTISAVDDAGDEECNDEEVDADDDGLLMAWNSDAVAQ